MRVRSIATGLLLVLAAFSAIEMAVDNAAFHFPRHAQWRVQTHGGPRMPQRNTPAIPGDHAAAPIVTLTGGLVLLPRPSVIAPFLTNIFVPPRVSLSS